MEFTKYETRGAYHWEEYEQQTLYGQHANKVKEWIKESNVLDVGCGDGLITHLLGCTGVDNHELAVSLAQEKGVDAEVGDVYSLTGTYDAVYLGDTIEHLDQPEKALKSIASVTNVLYLTTPPKRDPIRPFHVREWTPEELVGWMKKQGWTTDGVEVKYDRIYGRFILSQTKK